jgi:hypothetical protein
VEGLEKLIPEIVSHLRHIATQRKLNCQLQITLAMGLEEYRQESLSKRNLMNSLPKEIRAKIFSLLLSKVEETLSIEPKTRDQEEFLPLKTDWKSYDCNNRADELFLHPLTRVSREIRKEALAIIVSTNRYSTPNAKRLLAFLKFLRSSGRKELQEFEITLLPWYWAIIPSPETENWLREAIGLLGTCSSLRYLKIHLPPIWALCSEPNVESIWSKEDIMRMPVFAALAHLRGIERVDVEWTDYEDDWINDEHGFTFFRDRLCDHTVREAHTLLSDIQTWLVKSMSQPKREQVIDANPVSSLISIKEGGFPFLRLPREVRDHVYSLILTCPAKIRVIAANLDSQYEEQSTFFPLSPASRCRESMQSPILFTNQQLRAESQHTLYATNTFKLTSLSRLSIFFQHLGPSLRQQLRSLVIYMPHSCSLDETPPAEDIFDQLADCTKLTHLSLYLDTHFLCSRESRADPITLLAMEQILQNDMIAKLSALSGLKKVEITWIPYFASIGTTFPADLRKTISTVTELMCGQMQRPRNNRDKAT